MTQLNWKPTSPTDASSSAPSASSANPWFAISIGLMGLIVGFGIGKWRSGNLPLRSGDPPTQQVIQPPSPSQPRPSAPVPQAISFENVPAINVEKDHIRGNPNAEVVIVQYSDYECPFSNRVQATYAQIADTYGDKVAIIFRHFPLNFHPNAEPAAIAAECAAELGGNDSFWKFNDQVFETQGEWAYEKYAQELGLDAVAFKDCIGSAKFKQLVQDQLSGGSKAGVNGTPSNFILNVKTKKVEHVSGAQPFENFKTVIDAMLGDVQAAAPTNNGIALAAAAIPSGEARVIKMTSENWKFSPTVINAKKGEKITLEITGVSGIHGFGVPGLGINVPVQPGETITVDLPTNKTGNFPFLCTIPCGSGHAQMTGQIIIE